MLAVTREKLLVHLQDVPRLARLHARRDAAFVEGVVAWLAELEKTLLQLRLPVSALPGVHTTTILAVADGLRTDDVDAAAPVRKATRAVAVAALARMEGAARDEIARADARLMELREKLAQLLTVASAERPIPVSGGEANARWIERVWLHLGKADNARGLFTYLGAVLSTSDRLYLLGELLDNLVEAEGAREA